MGTTIIANNCIAGNMLHDLGMRFDTPTINLQILPREFPKFCNNLRHYMETEVVEYTNLSEIHKQDLINMFENIPPHIPYGLCDDIIIVFQHYLTFKNGKDAWDRRKARIDYDHIGYMFYIAHQTDKQYAKDFYHLELDNSIVFTENFELQDMPYNICYPPSKGHFLDIAPNGKKYYTQNFNPQEYITEVNK